MHAGHAASTVGMPVNHRESPVDKPQPFTEGRVWGLITVRGLLVCGGVDRTGGVGGGSRANGTDGWLRNTTRMVVGFNGRNLWRGDPGQSEIQERCERCG